MSKSPNPTFTVDNLTGLNNPVVQVPLATPQVSATEATQIPYRPGYTPNNEPPQPATIQDKPGTPAGVNSKSVLASVATTAGAVFEASNAISSIASGEFKSGWSSLKNSFSRLQGHPTGVTPGAEVNNESGEITEVTSSAESDWRVKISAPWDLVGQTLNKRLEKTNGLVFPYLPTVSISTSASYSSQGLTHNNYPFNAYQNSQIDDITIAGEFSCETPDDAEYWLAATLFLRAATKMFFGSGENVGSPPIICKLNGYGSHVFNNVSCVIKNFNVTLPPDVDYIMYQGVEKTWVPILSQVSVTVSPIYSREKIRKFNLQDYASGNIGATKGFM